MAIMGGGSPPPGNPAPGAQPPGPRPPVPKAIPNVKNPMAMTPQERRAKELAEGLGSVDAPQRGTKKDPYDARDRRSREEEILDRMIHNIEASRTWWDRVGRESEEDVEFAYFEQWSKKAKEERIRMRRPFMTFNLIPQYINSVIGSHRRSKFSIHVQQVGGVAEDVIALNGKVMSMAEVMEGIIRDIEATSEAHMAYARALQHALEGGIGWLHLNIEMGPHDPFNPELRIEHVAHRSSVIMDHLAERPNLQDSNHGWIGRVMHRDDFNYRYPQYRIKGTTTPYLGSYFTDYIDSWYKEDSVTVGKYYWKEPTVKMAVKMINPATDRDMVLYENEHGRAIEQLKKMGFRVVKKAEHETYDVKVILAAAHAILEGPFTWPGTTVPIFPVAGRQVDHNGERHYQSLHRHAKDSQIMFNYMGTMATEKIGKAPTAKWLVTAGSIAGYKKEWADQHIASRNVLPYNYRPDEPPPELIPGSEVPGAEVTLLQVARQNLMENIGMYQANLGQKSNETSGAAIHERQIAGESSTLEFLDNLAYSMATIGKSICECVPKIYTEAKIRRLVLEDDSEVEVVLNKNLTIQDESGKVTEHTIHQVGLARFEVNCTVGPGFTSQRQENLDALTEIAKTNPEMMGATMDIIVQNMDFPGRRMLAKRLKKMLPPHLLEPEEQMLVEPPQPTPEQQVEMKKIEQAVIKTEADQVIAQLRVEQENIQKEKESISLKTAQVKLEEARVEADLKNDATEEKIRKDAQGDGEDDGKMEKKVDARVKKMLAEENTKKKIKELEEAARKRKGGR